MRSIRWVFAVLVVLAGSLTAPPSGAQDAIIWLPSEVIDQPVTEISSNSSPSAVLVVDEWRVVYAREGQIRHCCYGALGWLPPDDVSTVPGTARDPHITCDGSDVYIVWEDTRTGIPEIWARVQYVTGVWSDEICLSQDQIPSRSPAVAAKANTFTPAGVLVVWQDGNAPSRIRGRLHLESWSAPVYISGGEGSASEPSAADAGWSMTSSFVVTWSDTRNGAAEIYMSIGDGATWPAATRVTNLPGPCARSSASFGVLGGDMFEDIVMVGFEHTAPGGVPEVWSACGTPSGMQVQRISTDDGLPSTRPGTRSTGHLYWTCGWPVIMPDAFLTWTEPSGTNRHWIDHDQTCLSESGPREVVSPNGLSWSTVAASVVRPNALLMVNSIQEIGGVSTLVTRRGSKSSCISYEIPNPPPALVIAPEGIPADTMRVVDTCTGEIVPDQDLMLHFEPSLEGDLTWDRLQEHPWAHATSGMDGLASFALRGGGCSTAGNVYLYCGGDPADLHTWHGVKSPDLDGNCVVGLNDREAVLAAFGTSDFCADLDGSGLVDAADLAIVDATLGDQCSQIAGVEPAAMGAALELSIGSNPCRDRTTVSITGATGPVHIRIVDIAGRLVRSIDAGEARGGAARYAWDTRDTQGRQVPSGLYVAFASGAGFEARRSVLVLR